MEFHVIPAKNCYELKSLYLYIHLITILQEFSGVNNLIGVFYFKRYTTPNMSRSGPEICYNNFDDSPIFGKFYIVTGLERQRQKKRQ